MQHLSASLTFAPNPLFLKSKALFPGLLKGLVLLGLLLLLSPARAQAPDWAFLKGYGYLPFHATYGSQGVAAAENTPGARYSPGSWEINGKFYLFGGYGNGTGYGHLNDLWEYDPATGNWRWLKGSMTVNQPGSHGTQGLAAPGNSPGARQEAASWTHNGKLYLFGGYGYDGGNGYGKLNDLWEYDPVTNNWRWLTGAKMYGQPDVYGTQGLAAPGNTPGARQGAASWQQNGKFYIFGGEAETYSTYYNDLWEYDPAVNTWTWIKGSSSANQGGSYGTQGVADGANAPGARYYAQTWENNGQLYLFGGIGNAAATTGNLNDLWVFDLTTKNWTWLKGSNAAGEAGVYGTRGTADAANIPGARANTFGWTQDGKLYLFGGEEEYYSGKKKFGDLWEFDPATGNWRWLKGGKLLDQPRITGTQGTADIANSPGGRAKAVGWQLNGRVYLFGGHATVGAVDVKLNDMWVFDPASGNWTWLEGSQTLEQLGVYGTQGLAAAGNVPGARVAMVNWELKGKLYLFGGLGAGNDHVGVLNDLWEYDPATKKWRWLTGSDTIYQKGSYGSKGVAAAGNTPGARYFASGWESGGKLYLFGGNGADAAGVVGNLNDLWEYDPAANTWRWVSGSDLANGLGHYGTFSVAGAGNVPGGRYGAVSWQNNGRLYLFGGFGNAAAATGNLNDLWEYNLSTGLWRWIKGSDQVDQAAIHGLQEVAEANNTPGARLAAVGWQLQDKLYLFGGLDGPSGTRANDLWEFDLTTHHWRWLKGSQVPGQVGTYGTQGLADANNTPGSRNTAFTWIGANKLYLFGGFGESHSGPGYLNDLWEYDVSSTNWTWLKGSNGVNQAGAYQTPEVAGAGNTPGARHAGASWFRNGQLLLFGGQGFGVDGDADARGDLWGIQLEAPNSPPGNIALSSNTLNENVAANSTVGTFSTADADAADLHTYSLVAGAGDADNAAFGITGNALRLLASPDYETKSSYSIRVRTDDGKVDGTFEKAFTITITDLDEVPPAAPAAPDLADASDSGTSNTDNITNVTRPVFAGTAEEGAIVKLFATLHSVTTQVGTATAAGGAWQITPPAPLVPGSYAITATATDAAGNTSTASPALALVIDTTVPAKPGAPDLLATSDTGASPTDNLTKQSSMMMFRGTAEAGSLVTLYQGATALGSATATDGNWQIAASGFVSGVYSLAVKATDAAGNASVLSDALAVTVDADRPDAPQITGFSDDTGLSASDRITKDQLISLTLTAEPGSLAFLYVDGTSVASNRMTASGTWTHNLASLLSPGPHTFRAFTLDEAGNSSPNSDDFTLVIDVAAPVLTDPTLPAARTYVAREQLPFTYKLSEAVTVSGSPSLSIRVGSSTRTAAYVSGSGTAELLFSYTVQPGDADADGVTVTSVSLNGGNMVDVAGNNATLTGPSAAASGVLVDAQSPVVTAVAVPAAGTYRGGQHLDLTVSFSENVAVNTAGGTPALPLAIGSTTRNAAYLSGSGTSALLFRYTVQAGEVDADGIALQSLSLNGATLQDAAGNDAQLALNGVASTAGVLVDALAPAFVQVNLPAFGTYKAGDLLDFQVDFSEPVLLSGTDSRLLLKVGSEEKQAALVAASGASILYRYIVQPGDEDADGIRIERLLLYTSTLRDAAGNDADGSFAPIPVAGLLVDGLAPVVTAVTVPAAASYKAGIHLDFVLRFSESISTTGLPSLGLTLGSSAKAATYLGGSGSSTLLFRYTVQPGDTDADGIAVQALSLNGGSLQDAAGNGAALALPGLPSTAGVLVDTRAPQALAVALPADKTYVNDEDLDFRVSFDEPVTVTGTPGLPLAMETGGSRYAAYVSGSGTTTLLFRYRVENGMQDENGLALGAALALNGGSLADAAGNAAGLPLPALGSTAGILVDGTAPRVVAVQVPAAKTYVAGEALAFMVQFSKALSVSGGSPSLALGIGSQTAAAAYQGGSGSNTLRFSYTVQAGELDTDGISLAAAIAANGAVLVDGTGNQAGLELGPVPGIAQVKVDAQAPVLTQVSLVSSNADASLAKPGDVVTLRFTASEALQTPVVSLAGRPATLTAGAANQYLASYTLTAAEAEGPLAFAVSFRDLVDNPGIAVTATSDNSGVRFDKSAPGVEISTQAPGLTRAAFQVTFTFSEAVKGFAPDDLVLANASASDWQAVSPSVFTALISPAGQGPVSVSVAAQAATDAAGNGNEASASLSRTYDSLAPGGYGIAFNLPVITFASQTGASAKVSGAEAGASYSYVITSAGGGAPLSGAGTVAGASFDIAGLNLSGLADGALTLTLVLTDAAGNTGLPATAQVIKYTRNLVSFSAPGALQVPIRTPFAQTGLPATLEVRFSDNSSQQLAVTWQPGSYNGLAAGSYQLSGTFTLPAGTTNLGNLQAVIEVVVAPNKAPTALSLSQRSFHPGIAGRDANTPEAIGSFTTSDADDSEHRYMLASGPGSNDNALFEIIDNQLFLKSNKGLSGQSSFAIRVQAVDPYQNTIEQTFALTKQPYNKPVADLKIVNTFSPNGDGVNDTWMIPELRFYNQVELEVYDRSGARLFFTLDPEKGWDGKDSSGQLLKGAFLYVLKIQDIGLVKKGVVTILRK
ncbi:MAG: Kelch repeat-containing protein [Adhaeribacter sp.]